MYEFKYFIIVVIGHIIASFNTFEYKECNNHEDNITNDDKISILSKETITLYSTILGVHNKSIDDIINADNITISIINNDLQYDNNNVINFKDNCNIENQNLDININHPVYKVEHNGINKRRFDEDKSEEINLKQKRLEMNFEINDNVYNNLLIHENINCYNYYFDETRLKYLVIFKTFKYVFRIIENDLIETLKIYFNFSVLENQYILNIISELENLPLDEQKIIYFINITNDILSKDNLCKSYNCNRQMFINQILSTNYAETKNKKIIRKKLYLKSLKIDLNVKRKNITNNDIFNITIDYINNTTDKMIQNLFIYGFQSLFNSFSKYMIPKLYHILIFTYTFNYEKEYYDLDWHEKFFEIVSLCYFKNKFLKRYYEMINISYKNEFIKSLNLYIAINSEDINVSLHNLNELISDETNLKYVIYFIELICKIKCKLFGIKFDY
ncbi:hypothetical protein NAPIS_ORF02266 [Vairimorpha apis BRL 01]|uniref:Uncharacterized protein n=1 Tax=Vairimorpha apis BRL 01 TaxID=1037528 RepID=T0MGK3_9MICR|nr:hypothetical protein NAPIS_ORF02266 [Vairimorpha apis BRL 01]